MKILISNDGPFAHYYIRMSLGRCFTIMGHTVVMWDIHKKPVYDAFDEFEPDLFIGQTYNINRGLIQCLAERPACKVIMKAADWGPRTHSEEKESTIDLKKYPVLVASDEELDNVRQLQAATGKPDLVYVHYMQNRVDVSHKYWQHKLGIKIHSLMNAADIIQYTNGIKKPEYECDFCFLGGKWGYKARTIDKFIMPLLRRDLDYNVKIFGNQPWGTSQYCGFLPEDEVKHLFSSAKIGVNVSEPHSQDLGYDIIERPFKLMASKLPVVSDHVEDLVKLFPTEIMHTPRPEDFKAAIDALLENPDRCKELGEAGYKAMMMNHTYFHRVRDLMFALDKEDEAGNAMRQFRMVKEKLKL